MAADWEKKAAASKAKLDESIPQDWKRVIPDSHAAALDHVAECDLLTAKELGITQMSAIALVADLANGKLTSVEVTLAFCKRAALAIQWTNCGHEFFPDEAMSQARQLDDYFKKYGKPIGPLHGLPISLKDQLRIKGHETHMGYVSWIGRIDEEDSILIALLRKAGAVFYVKTSVPQTLMTGETVNNIIGRTVNPRNKAWTCGGSSGGEGAMVGFRGGVIGIGTDIGGSIRIPAAFNFLYGIRPSHGRMPYGKMANSMQGQETVHSVVGPMAHSASDLRLLITSVLNEQPWQYDSKVIPMPWRVHEEEIIHRKARLGNLSLAYYENDGNVQPHPPVIRAVNMVVSCLEKAGHSVRRWQPYRHDFAGKLVGDIYIGDGCVDVYRDINASGEPPIFNHQKLLDPNSRSIDMIELWDVQLQKWNYQMEYLQKWLDFEETHGAELDAIIAPVTPTACVRHDQYKYYGYSAIVNLLDWTSVVVPVTFADKDVDKVVANFSPLNEMDTAVHEEYDAEAYHGAPVAIQILGRRLTEEKTLAIAEEIGRLLGNSLTP